MKIRLYIKRAFCIILTCITLLTCSNRDNTTKFIIEGNLIPSGYGYSYNPNGFINTPYGKLNISTIAYFKNDKLINLLWNKPNGFLEYSIEYLRNESKLYRSFKVDSLFSKNEIKFSDYKSTIRNDTIFYKENKKVIIVDLK